MMHGPEKSDPAIVAMKPTNKAGQPAAERSAAGSTAAEPVERRAGAKGNAGQQSTRRTQSRASVSQALERIRQRLAVTHPRWEPYAGKPHVRFCAGGAQQWASLPLRVIAALHFGRF
jgi:RNA-directed DNA polymerase